MHASEAEEGNFQTATHVLFHYLTTALSRVRRSLRVIARNRESPDAPRFTRDNPGRDRERSAEEEGRERIVIYTGHAEYKPNIGVNGADALENWIYALTGSCK